MQLIIYLIIGIVASQTEFADGRAQKIVDGNLYTPRQRLEEKRKHIIFKLLQKNDYMLLIFLSIIFYSTICQEASNDAVDTSTYSRSMDPPLAPSYGRLEQMINLFKKNSMDKSIDNDIDENMLPCLLKPEGCNIDRIDSISPKPQTNDYTNLTITKSTIMNAVDGLQKKLDMKTAEIVKEIERRAAELRREIAIEAEEVGEAILYLTSMLGDSVMKADEMGAGFVREWFDEASQRYTGLSAEQKQKLNDEASIWDAEIHVYDSTESSVESIPTHVKHSKEILDKHLNSTREKYNYTNTKYNKDVAQVDETTENLNLYEKAFDSVLVEKVVNSTNQDSKSDVLNNTNTSSTNVATNNINNSDITTSNNNQRRFGIYK